MTSKTAELRQYLENNFDQAMQILRRMVDINSFTRNPTGVNILAQYTADQFEPLGFTAEMIQPKIRQLGKHLFMTKQGKTDLTIALVSHLDTVYTEKEELDNDFTWREEVHGSETRLYGPGTNDIKGGTVVMWQILSAIKACAPDLFEYVTWKVFLDSAEEEFSTNFGGLCCQALDPEKTLACLVFEAGSQVDGRPRVVTARKGMARYHVSVDGKSAHSGTSHEYGANAIVQMADVVQQIAGFTDYDNQLTFNIGTIEGGTLVNRVPHHAEIKVEFRTFKPDVYDDALAKMSALDGYSSVSSVADHYPCTTHIDKVAKCAPWPVNDKTESLFAVWEKAGHDLDLDVLPEQRGGLSDGNFLWQHVPTLDGLGPLGEHAHSAERSEDGRKDQEYAVKESFVPNALLHAVAILMLVENKLNEE